jgi:predicted Ser/Thr protein kinase
MAPTRPGDASIPPSELLSPAALAPHFPQLEILECLGRGGMGVVYKARQKALGRIVALKILAPERSTDPGFAERFTAEARMLASLNHPNIVTIHDFGQSGGFYHLVMEFVDGVNLRQAMTAGRFTPEQALAIVPPVCEALQYAHDHGVVHRDIKPENLLLDQEGRVKVADFGIAKLLGSATAGGPDAAAADSAPAAAPPSGAGAGGPPETLEASAAGTPQYMAPEQRARGPVDHRADIYSLGVVLYELLTGETPKTSLEAPSRKIQIDVRLDEVVLRALAVAPELRFSTATEFRTRVEALTAPATPVPVQPPPALAEASSFRPIHRSLVPLALAYQWMATGWVVLAGIEALLFALTESMSVEWVFSYIFPFFFVWGLCFLPFLASHKAAQWLGSLESRGRRALNQQAALFFPLLAGGAWMATYPVFGQEPSIRRILALAHFGVAGFPWVLLRQASNRSPSRSLMGRLTNNFTLPVVLLTAIVAASMSGGRLESLAHRISRAVHREPVVPSTWPAVALDVFQGPVPARWSPGSPVLQILPLTPRVEGSDPTTFKEIVLKEFHNESTTIDPSCRTETPFRPGESLEVWTKRSDGHFESVSKLPMIFQSSRRRSQTLSMLFHLPESFIGFKLPLIAELRPKLEGRTLRLPEGQPMTLFGLTNRDGSWLNGDLTFHRMLPDDRQPAVATLRSKSQSSFGRGHVETEWTANVPSGYALELRAGGSAAKNGGFSSTTIVGNESVDFRSDVHLHSVRKGQVILFDNALALKQLESLAATGPLLVTNGHPRTLFAVTNALGESYSLAIELVSYHDEDP